MASIQKISKAYRGKLAENYDAVRLKQKRWHLENKIVAEMLESCSGPVLDCPVGTGRFFDTYRKLGLDVTGVDASEEMLALARKKLKRSDRILVMSGSADNLKPFGKFDTTVCVRFLNLIEPEALRAVMAQLLSVTRRRIILTIRLGPEYHSNSQMATHDEAAFRRLITRGGWRVVRDEYECFIKGWHLMMLERKR